jgi:hypothetical protein
LLAAQQFAKRIVTEDMFDRKMIVFAHGQFQVFRFCGCLALLALIIKQIKKCVLLAGVRDLFQDRHGSFKHEIDGFKTGLPGFPAA